jgi:hypothetical protein
VVFENGRQFLAPLYGYTKDDFFAYFAKLGYDLFQFTGGIFKEDDWDKDRIYWETWLVHRDSKHHDFFMHHYQNFLNTYIRLSFMQRIKEKYSGKA